MFLFQQPEPVLAQLKEFGPQPKAGRMQCIQICSRIQYVLTYDDIVYMFGLPQKPQRYALNLEGLRLLARFHKKHGQVLCSCM